MIDMLRAVIAHEWTALELVLVLFTMAVLAWNIVELLADACVEVRFRLRRYRRRIVREGASLYADPARIHRETCAVVERLAERMPAPQPAAASTGTATSQSGARVSGIPPTGVDDSASHAAFMARLDDASYGVGTTLVDRDGVPQARVVPITPWLEGRDL